MPRYYFDAHDGIEVIDKIGRILPSVEVARQSAVQLVADYAKDPSNLGAGGIFVVTVRDDHGSVLATVRLICQIET